LAGGCERPASMLDRPCLSNSSARAGWLADTARDNAGGADWERLGMNLIAWTQNMTPEAAKAAGAILVSKYELFEQADILTPIWC
jgi:hypothetical protein